MTAEDTNGLIAKFPTGASDYCRVTIDGTAPPAPVVTSEDFAEATSDGATWARVKFGQSGSVTFFAEGATQFSYSLGGLNVSYVSAVAGRATVNGLRPRHSGPNNLQVYAYDAIGNRSLRTDYLFYLPPSEVADKAGDATGDGKPDLIIVDALGNLRTFPGDIDGNLDASLAASYTNDSKLDPQGHWWNSDTGKAALITKYSDAYPGSTTNTNAMVTIVIPLDWRGVKAFG